jgi:protein-S-isoprenylcysteine O-methyltransferase Ste14
MARNLNIGMMSGYQGILTFLLSASVSFGAAGLIFSERNERKWYKQLAILIAALGGLALFTWAMMYLLDPETNIW